MVTAANVQRCVPSLSNFSLAGGNNCVFRQPAVKRITLMTLQ